MKKTLIKVACVAFIVASVGGYLALRISEEVPNLAGKKVLMVIAPENFRDEEYRYTREELERAKASITVASTKTTTARGMLGATVTPDLKLEQVDVDDYDAVIFVGGGGSAVYFDNDRALSIASEAFDKGKKTCAICIAPVILANAGVLNGKRATVFDGDYIEAIEAKGATFVNKPVVVDGNVITANGPGAARDFGRTIARELAR